MNTYVHVRDRVNTTNSKCLEHRLIFIVTTTSLNREQYNLSNVRKLVPVELIF